MPETADGEKVRGIMEKRAEGCGLQLFGNRPGRAHIVPADSPFVQTLLECYESVKGVKGYTISTGGGTVMNPVNRHIMRTWGTIVLIDRPLDDILSDIKLDRRPTLNDLEEVKRVYQERIPVYRALADITMTNDKGYHMAVYILTRLVRERL